MTRDSQHRRRQSSAAQLEWRRVWSWLHASWHSLTNRSVKLPHPPPASEQPPAASPRRSSLAAHRDTPLAFEPLERRALLAAWPIANPDLTFQQPDPTATQLSVPAASGLLANDYDPDTAAASLRVHTAWVAGGGSLTWAADGSFTFTRAANFSGIARFFYQTSDGARTSYPAEVKIAFDSPFSPNLLASEHASGSLLHAGAWTTRMQVSPDWSYLYRSDTVDPLPVLAVEALYAGTPVGRSVTAIKSELFRGGSRVSQATYTEGLSPLAAGTRLRFALQDGSAALLPTGRYDYTFRLTVQYDNQTSRTVDYTLSKSLVNRSNDGFQIGSQFGQGWWLEGLDQLHLQPGGALWVRDNGDAFWFALQGSSYATAPGDETFSNLTRPGGGNQFVLTDKWGQTRTFQLSGGNIARLSQVKALNNVTPTWRYFYDPAGRLTTIRDEYNRAWTFQQLGEFTTALFDYQQRPSTFEYKPGEPGVLVVCRWPMPNVLVDPDLTVQEVIWRCGTDGGRLIKLTDPRGVTEEPVYSSLGLVEAVKHGDETALFVSPMLAQGLPEPYATNAALHVVYDAPNGISGNWPFIRDERGKTTYFKTNEFGAMTQLVDADGHRSDAQRSNRNQLYRLIAADPDGASGPLARPVTELGHNFWGDEVLVRNPDGTTRTATWHATFHRPRSRTNELGQVDRFEYDAVGNLIFSQDATNRRWDYVYDQTLANAADRHGRLLEVRSPDPDGAGPLPRLVTRYEYEPAIWHRVSRQFNSDHTAAAPSFRSFTYDERDNLRTETDERQSLTRYTPDHYDRLRIIALPPDHDGNVGVIKRTYDRLGQLSEELDPLGHRTVYNYDSLRGWLDSIQQFSAGGVLLATTSYEYFADGRLRSTQLPSHLAGTAEYYRYDGRGNLSEVTSPSGGVTTLEYDGLSRLVLSRDPSGREQVFTYDNRDRLTAARDHDPDGSGPLPAPTTTYAYDAASRLVRRTDPLGRVTAYNYLANGWLQNQTLPDPDGALGPMTGPTIHYAYNNLGQVTKVTAPGGRVTDTTYDHRARVASVIGPDPDGAGPLPRPSTAYQYLRTGELLTATDHLGRRTDYDYDRLGRLLSMLLPDIDGNAATTSDRPLWQYRYDLAGNLVRTIDPLAQETVIEPDGLGRPAKVLEPDPDGNPATVDRPIWQYVYGANALISAVTDPLGRTTSYEYDNFGRRTATLEPAVDGSTSPTQRATVRYEYDALDRLQRVLSDADGFGAGVESSATAYTYDRYGRLASETDARGGITRYGYDLAGQLTSLRDPSGNETRWAYDGLGRQKLETNQLGHSRHFDYDLVGNLTRRTDRNGRLVVSAFDLLDRQTRETWHAAKATARTQTTRAGAAGVNEQQTISFSGLTATNDKFQLGFAGEVSRILPFNASAAGVKSALEELLAIDGVSVTLATSGATRIYTVTFGGSLAGQDVPLLQAAALPAVNGAQQNVLDYQYNAAGLIAQGGDAAARYTWQYDGLNRQTSESADLDPANPLNSLIGLTQSYDLAGHRTELAARFTDFSSSGVATQRADFRNSYTYDRLGRLESIQQTPLGGAGSNGVAAKRVELSYNPLGQLTALSRFENSSATGPALRTSWSYDQANRLSSLRHAHVSGQTSATLHEYTFQYDLMNRLTGIGSTLDGASSFTYDAASQLKSAAHAAPRVPEAYQYDATGNRQGGTQQVGVNNQTLGDAQYTYQYDAEGNRTRRTDRTSGAIEDFTWDHRNRLTRITFRTSAGVETRSIEYRYDLLNRLVLRRLDSNGSAVAGGVSDLWLAGYDGINTTLALSSLSSSAVTNRYLWGPGVDFLLADEQLSPASPTAPVSAGNTLWPLGDHLGTLRDLADFSGSAFTITNHRIFDTFGRLTSESNSAVDSHFAFTGKFFDDLGDAELSTSLSHHWNRWYDPHTGKWLSEDPIGFAGGDMNLGRYVGNHVTGAVDWSGWYQDGGTPPGSDEPLFGVYGINGRQPIISFRPFGERTIGSPNTYVVPEPARPQSGEVSGESSSGGVLDWVQGGLDFLGVLDPTPVCDTINSAICGFRGNWTDAGLTIAGVIPFVGDFGKAAKHAKKLTKAAGSATDVAGDVGKASDAAKAIQANKAAGDAWEAELLTNHLPKTQTEIRPQITIRSAGPSGKKVKVDAVGTDTISGEIKLTEGKASATAPLTPNQTIVYPELAVHGGTVVGKGKPPYSGGTQVPPTKVDVLRKN